MTEQQKSNDSLYRRAFFNQYNAILLGGTALFALATFSWLPLVVGAGIEVLGMTLLPDTKLFKRWANLQKGRQERERMAREAEEAARSLEPGYAERFAALQHTAVEIQDLARENASIETRLIDDELAKMSQLLAAFLRMATVHQRLAGFLRENSADEIDEEIQQCQRELKRERDARVQASLRQALTLAEKRLKQHQQISAGARALEVQMETLEKSLSYLKSHVVAIGSREELASELDDLVLGVDSVERLDTETSGLLDELHRSAAARAQRVAQRS